MIAIEKAELKENLANVEAVLLRLACDRVAPPGLSRDDECIFNSVEFAVIFNGDLTTCLFSLERSFGDWDSRFHARVLALLLLESTKKFASLLGKEMRAVIGRHGNDEHKKELMDLHSIVVERSRRFELSLGGLRDNAIAHRDRSAARQLLEIRALDVDNLERDGWEMIRWLNKVYGLMSSVSTYSRS